MKIAVVIETYSVTGGGAERSTAQIVNRLIEQGHQVTLITNRSEEADQAMPGVVVCEQGGLSTKTSLGLMLFRYWAIRQLKRGSFDVSLSVTLAVPATVVQPRSGTARETNLRNVAMRRTPFKRALKRLTDLLNFKKQALLFCEWRTLHSDRVRVVVAISHYVKDQLIHHYTYPVNQIELIPNAAAVQRFTPEQRSQTRAKIRRQLGIEDDHVAFLFVAINPTLKGLDPLVKAFAQVLDQCPRAVLVVASPSVYSVSKTLTPLHERNAVRHIGVTRRIDAMYAACDVTVLPTFYDPSSKVVIESLLHGVPAISTRYNGASQWILDPSEQVTLGSVYGENAGKALPTGKTGRVVDDPKDIDSLANALLELCDDQTRESCVQNIVGLEDRVSMDRHVKDLEKLLNRVALH